MNNKKQVKVAVYIAVLTVIAFILNFIEIPYLIPWLKIEISEVITLIATSMSLIIGVFVAIAKGVIMMLTGTSSGFIGEITLIIGSLSIVLCYYFFNKKFSTVISLVFMGIVFVILMTVLNYFFITPFYFDSTWQQLAGSTQTLTIFGTQKDFGYLGYIIIVYVPFNALKIALDSIIFFFLNKKLKKVI